MKERPILFCGEMVRAILDGRKTQTRRVIKWPERYTGIAVCAYLCPYGVPGDRLWVRETWAPHPEPENHQHAKLGYTYRADWDRFDDADLRDFQWTPSLHMPRSASRITLEITRVRVQRVQEITFDDCVAEGINQLPGADAEYRRLWNSINAKSGFGWDANPWVWAITFKMIEDTRL